MEIDYTDQEWWHNRCNSINKQRKLQTQRDHIMDDFLVFSETTYKHVASEFLIGFLWAFLNFYIHHGNIVRWVVVKFSSYGEIKLTKTDSFMSHNCNRNISRNPEYGYLCAILLLHYMTKWTSIWTKIVNSIRYYQDYKWFW